MFGTVQQLLGDNNLDKAGKGHSVLEIHNISRHLAEAEAIFGTLGARRTEVLNLQSLQQQLLREKGLQLLKARGLEG